jgi:hypothetical protein
VILFPPAFDLPAAEKSSRQALFNRPPQSVRLKIASRWIIASENPRGYPKPFFETDQEIES